MRLSVVVGVTLGLLVGGLEPGTLGAAERGGGITAELVVGGLDFPAAFTFTPDGRIFYAEHQGGEIRIYDPATASNTRFATVPNVATEGEQGLLGLALHPQYPAMPFVYVFATRDLLGESTDQIIRLRDAGGRGRNPRVIFTQDVFDNWNHHGGRLLFGSEEMLYVITGDAEDPANAQNLDTNSGKVLRMTPKGTVPPDNPIPGSLVYAYGIRNSFGLAFDPESGYLWDTQNGPACNDEVNVIWPGANYGWGPGGTCLVPPDPPVNTNQDGPDPVLPVSFYTPTIAPVGIVFCSGCGLAEAEGALFFGAFNTGDIRQATLTEDRTGFVLTSIPYTHSAPVLSMERGPDGALYFSEPDGIYKLVAA